MTGLIAAEFRKLATTRLWLWLLIVCAVWVAAFTALAVAFGDRPGGLTPPLADPAGQHALLAVGAGGVSPLVAILGVVGVTGEFRHRTITTTFLAAPARGRVITAKHIAYALAGIGYAVICIAIALAVALPSLAARHESMSLTSNGNLAVLASIPLAAAIFAIVGVGLGSLASEQLATVTGLLIFLYVAEPLLTHVPALSPWTAYLPGVADDAMTQASQTGVHLLPPWLGGAVFAGWAAAFAIAGAVRIIRRDIT